MKVLWNSNWGSYFYYLDAWNSLFHVLFCLWEYHLVHPSLALSSPGSAESRSRHCPNCLVLVDVSQKFLLQIQAPQTLSHRYLGKSRAQSKKEAHKHEPQIFFRTNDKWQLWLLCPFWEHSTIPDSQINHYLH